jgi:hypothetical protein
MATKKVNIEFGGTIPCTDGGVAGGWETYRSFATQGGYTRFSNGFIIEYDFTTQTVNALSFRYRKSGLLESGLQAFNDSWATVAAQYGVTRSDTIVSFYTE